MVGGGGGSRWLLGFPLSVLVVWLLVCVCECWCCFDLIALVTMYC